IRSFLSRIFVSGDRSPYGGFWFEPVGVQTVAGLRVTADSALQLSAVFACVRIIASQFASLPFTLYRNRPDGGKDRVTNHPIYTLLARRPNPYQNAFEWREMMAGHLALRGNAYNQIVSDSRGNITALLPLHPDRMQILLSTNGDYRYRYTQLNGAQVTYSRGEIWHLRGLSSDGIIGLSPIALARNAIGGAQAAQDYGARFFANDATPTGGWVEYPGAFKDKQSREQFRESLQEGSTTRSVLRRKMHSFWRHAGFTSPISPAGSVCRHTRSATWIGRPTTISSSRRWNSCRRHWGRWPSAGKHPLKPNCCSTMRIWKRNSSSRS
ncbi:MAG: phage portal protein, partial [Burkholderiales bacterium 21-58-4]